MLSSSSHWPSSRTSAAARAIAGRVAPAGRAVEFRQHDVADTVARILQVRVGLVLHPRFAARGQIRPQVGPRHVQQRPDDQPAPGIDAAEAGQPGAAHQLQQERLGLVVLRVADGDAVGPGSAGGPAEKVVADPAGCILERQATCSSIRFDVGVVRRRLGSASRPASSRQNASSRSADGRSWWLRCASDDDRELVVRGQLAQQEA